ncbi:hypothetical protein FE257_002039 [Aspergillus nanangensis]|uniref:Probable beta-glucosidase G n=1 Tax=Aspergillus nanangensis TaxID=2582783 RepID=A0AAD4CV38_ASPNN|nr:hypothetical protein FE257_002039 [Aspergillus nanangensis]
MAPSDNNVMPSLSSCLRLLLLAVTQVNGLTYTSPSVLPSPPTEGLGGWDAALSEAQSFVSQLTLEEKQNMVTGVKGPCVGNIAPISRLGFKGLCFQDGPLAIRQATNASVFPAGLSAAATWDNDLIEARGAALAREFKDKGSHVLLGPVAGPLGRSALGGRNWEGFSPDPYLTGLAFARTIKGIQDTGVQACIKHIIGYEQETQRFPSKVDGVEIKAINSNIDDRTIHELYLWPFADGVKQGAASAMSSYNRINGTYAAENSKVLNGLLKEELGFQGYVVSDWGGTYSGAPSVNAGLDMEMPGGEIFGSHIGKDIDKGAYKMSRLDDMIVRVMTPYYFLNQNKGFPSVDPSSADIVGFDGSDNPHGFDLSGSSYRNVRRDHAILIRQIGSDGAVLLKNTNHALPLSKPKEIGVFGYDADAFPMSNGQPELIRDSPYGYKNGSLPTAGGSGAGRFSYVVSPLSAIQAKAHEYGAHVQSVIKHSDIIPDKFKLDTVPDVCLVFIKSWATEGADRLSLDADFDGNLVVEKVAAVCDNTVVISHSVGPNLMDFADNENVTAIIASHLPGQEIGNSIVDILWGAVNPSGKLPYTIAHKASDYNGPIANVSNPTTADAFESTFTEGLMIDYRHFDHSKIKPRYEFGFGLSYTTFSIKDLDVQNAYDGHISARPPSAKTQPGGNPHLYDTIFHITCTVYNTGSVKGKAVPQLYISLPSSAPDGTPAQALRGYNKVSIGAHESTKVTFSVLRKHISYWDVTAQDWVIPKGKIDLRVGFSSRDVQASHSIAAIA